MKARQVSNFLAAILASVVLYLAISGIGKADDPPPPTPDPAPVDVKVQGKTAAGWHVVAERYLNSKRQMLHAIRFDPEVSTAINLSCTVYGHCAELWRKARCESHLHRYSANATSSARGLLQFLTTGWTHRYGDHARVNGGTWATTPYWRFSVYDPYANALAAGWMHAHGRGGEWTCR